MPARRRVSPRLLIALTLAGAFACYLAGNGSASLIDRDEPRYAQCSREMLRGSPEHPGPNWVVPRHLGELRYAKPAGIYWLQASAMTLIGDADGPGVFAARLPSAVAMPVTLGLVALGVWRWAGAGRAVWTVFVLATCVMVVLAAKVCLTDSVLLLWITIAQGCLYLAYRGRAGWGTWATMGVATGLAGLIKGPPVLGVMGMTLVALGALRLVDAWIARRRARRAPRAALPEESGSSPRAQTPASDAPDGADARHAGTNEPTAQASASPNEPTARHAPGTNEPTPDREGYLSQSVIGKEIEAESEAVARAGNVTNEPTEGRGNRSAGAPRSRANEPTARRSPARVALGILLAVVLLGGVVAPWLYLLNQREPSFLGTAVSHDVVKRIKTGLEGHSGPPGYHLLTIWGTYLPWSILLPMSIVFAWKRRHLPPVRFALAAVLGPWAMFEVVQTKLPHYMLPVFPFLAFLTGDAIVRCLRGQHNDLRRRSFVAAVAAWAAILGLIALGPLLLSVWFGQGVGVAAALLPVGLAYVVGVVVLFAKRRTAGGLVAMGVGMPVVLALVWAVFLPMSDPLRLSIRVAEVLKAHGATGPGQVAMLDYKEPSLAYYQGGTIRENPATRLTDAVVDAAPPWMVITRDVWDHPQTSPAARDRLEVVSSIEGLAYADTGRRLTVMVVRKRR